MTLAILSDWLTLLETTCVFMLQVECAHDICDLADIEATAHRSVVDQFV